MKKKINKKDKEDMFKEEKERIIPVEGEDTAEIESQEVSTTEAEEEYSVEQELDKIADERDEFKDKWLRTLAEFDNFRRNTLKEKSDWMKYSNEKLILEVCDVFDNFERALSTDVNADNFKAFQDGIALIYQQLEALLKRNNVTKIEYEEKEFDPNFHEALAHIPSEYDENIIAALIQNGYKMNEKVIRAARVAVSNGNKPEKKEK
ncbi:MAG TPA: nucleotide exchange factor GrpE [Candidatus Cloacimonadota bacterium]|nr:nucleotide exchange factor GrpE [Candidatus Cloacimonadota bacterium]HOQ80299.1 nucleotide exchange factor GrpE [Candidatus Cloacimonadota bacterium]HPK41182.1 nucleotide exchange factor GrpE [Candidatus Cloacimonadota bacterium]